MRSLVSFIVCSCVLLSTHCSLAQVNDHKYKVLFLGNSYTYVNDLPATTASAALSAGDSLVYDGNTIGGYTLQQHSTDATSVGKIATGTWDYVVLQEQSQLPSFTDADVASDVFPYAHYLDSLVHYYNSCARSMFYMTWGRKNGDASNCPTWPPVCTYMGMDSLLRKRYMMMADSNSAIVSPVGAVWRYIRAHYPSIELYQSDESHPSEAGTYAAACCFYTTIFKKSPLLISFNSTLSATDAANIRTAVKNVVYDSIDTWHIRDYAPSAHGSYAIGSGSTVTFTNTSTNATSYSWNFGDGATSTLAAPTYGYSGSGTYSVTLVAINCGKSDTLRMVVPLGVSSVANGYTLNTDFAVSPNPVQHILTVRSSAFLANGYDITVANSLGQIVYRAKSDGAVQQLIDVADLSKGLYFISVSGNGVSLFRSKFVKE